MQIATRETTYESPNFSITVENSIAQYPVPPSSETAAGAHACVDFTHVSLRLRCVGPFSKCSKPVAKANLITSWSTVKICDWEFIHARHNPYAVPTTSSQSTRVLNVGPYMSDIL